MYLLQKFKKILQIEKKKYSNKGLANTALSFSLFFTIFWVIRQIGQHYWPPHIEDKAWFLFIGSVTIHTISQLVALSIYLPGYLGMSSYHQKYLINKRSKWPWKRQDWPQLLKKTLSNLFINQICVYPFLSYSASSFSKVRFQGFPSYQQLLTQIIFIYFTQDFFFYWAHRFAHDYFYKLHKIHHQYDKIYSAVTQYFHPLDYALANVIPSSIGFIILGSRAHCFTFFYWIFWKVMISSQGHSGYEFPWSPTRAMPLVTGASYHDHHHSNNVGNYAGSCYFWDVMLQTGETYFQDFLGKQKRK